MSPTLIPNISIIIPVGAGRDGRAALQSLLQTKFEPGDEVIVVCDGHTMMIPDKFRELPVRCLSANTQVGANAARNLGAWAAKGEFLCFLDDDDQYEPEAIYRIRSMAVGQIAFSVWSLGWTIASGKTLKFVNRPAVLTEQDIWKRNIAGGCSSMVMRKTVFEQTGGFDEEMRSMQDWEYWIRLSRLNPIGTRIEPLIRYNDHTGPRISTNRSARIAGLTRLLEKNRAYWPRHVQAFHEARLSAEKWKEGEGSWLEIFNKEAILPSLWFMFEGMLRRE